MRYFYLNRKETHKDTFSEIHRRFKQNISTHKFCSLSQNVHLIDTYQADACKNHLFCNTTKSVKVASGWVEKSIWLTRF